MLVNILRKIDSRPSPLADWNIGLSRAQTYLGGKFIRRDQRERSGTLRLAFV
jgi:hypothetical protein